MSTTDTAPLEALRAFASALSARPDDYSVLTVATRESDHQDVSLSLGDLRAVLAELERLRNGERAAIAAELRAQAASIDEHVRTAPWLQGGGDFGEGERDGLIGAANTLRRRAAEFDPATPPPTA